MISLISPYDTAFKGHFEIERLPERKFRRIVMDMNPETIDKMSKVLPVIKNKVEKSLPEEDMVKFQLFRSAFFGDNRYQIQYFPSIKSQNQGATPKIEENWPYNIESAVDFVNEIINSVGKKQAIKNFLKERTNTKLDLLA
ncbi:MAG: hypothetical protein ACD_20C00390G0004 [uncultured bacterium]|nr:MAG: hypothetical protein ACD_20C00390G0004 [uncultured bacterium]HBH18191.1 hypothetical protein [Cyanobacteria bacterium UBA9579]